MNKEIAYELARGTVEAALAVFPLSGKAKKNEADHLAVEAMREALRNSPFGFKVLIGEGEKDNAPMLYAGETLGLNQKEESIFDLIVDPLECTTNFSKGLPDSLSVICASKTNTIQDIPGSYMKQFLAPLQGFELGSGGLDADPSEVLPRLASGLGISVQDLTVVVQDRPRHTNLISQIRATGSGVSLIESGSISAALEILFRKHKRIHALWGTFGAPEGLVLAALAKCARGTFVGEIAPHDEASQKSAEVLGILEKSLKQDEWFLDEPAIFLSGIHSNSWIQGVRQDGKDRIVDTLVITESQRLKLTHINGKLSQENLWQTFE